MISLQASASGYRSLPVDLVITQAGPMGPQQKYTRRTQRKV